jgi:protein ImuB
MKPARSNSRVLCAWLPQWPVQRLRSARPELKRRALALHAPLRGCPRIVASSSPALAPGMTLTDAAAIAPIHFEAHDPLADWGALVKLAAACEEFSPTVGVDPPDNLCLNVTGLGPLFGGEEALARQASRALARQGVAARIAIADTLGAAWALAHFGGEDFSGEAIPIIISPGQTVAALAPLPIAALRLADEIEILAELGIERIGQLAAAPREALAARFGPRLLLRLDQATGAAAEPIVSHRPPPDIVAEIALEFSTDDRLAIDALLSRLVERVAADLAQRGEGAIRLECCLRCESGEPVLAAVGLFRASAAAKHLLELARLRLERVALPAPLVGMRLAVLTAARLQSHQQELFESSRRDGRREVGLLVDRLSNRLGREAVARALPQADAQPELAFRYEPLAGAAPREKGREKGDRHILLARHRKMSQSPASRWKLLPRPTRLEAEPIRLEVVSVIPGGPPIQFHFHGPHRVAQAWGPERIQTGWWRGEYVQRDYYRVETTAGRRFWLFRRLADGAWFLHGTFD